MAAETAKETGERPYPSKRAMELRNVGVCYRNRKKAKEAFWALHDVSFDLYKGETLGVIGRNGAGKTTLMRILAGILGPDRGEVVSHGGRATLLSLQAGFSAQLTGSENAILSGMLLGIPRKEMKQRLEQIREFSELGAFLEEPVHTYSAGMKARLGFAVAVHADPDILLLDELLGVGDAAFKKKSAQAMKDKIRSEKTIVLVSHNIGLIKELCDRAVWIHKGSSVQEGAVDTVINAYNSFAGDGK